MPEYRRKYVAQVRAREFKHGDAGAKPDGSLLKSMQVRSKAEVAVLLGITREAVRQVENRAIYKIRCALKHLYQELEH